jgi:hypothetical protein
MPVHLRVDLPDRPGALAQLADGLARAGADVLSVAVTERCAGRAIDDFLVDWPAEHEPDLLAAAVTSVAGCRLLGLRRVATVPDENPSLDLLTHVMWQPQRALETLVDMLPSLAGADWAAVAVAGRPLYRSATAPALVPKPTGSRTRAHPFAADDTVGVFVPLPGEVALVVARLDAPRFSRREIDDLARLTELTVALVRALLPQDAARPSRLTAMLLPVALGA